MDVEGKNYANEYLRKATYCSLETNSQIDEEVETDDDATQHWFILSVYPSLSLLCSKCVPGCEWLDGELLQNRNTCTPLLTNKFAQNKSQQ